MRVARLFDSLVRQLVRIELAVVLAALVGILASVLWGVLTRYVSHHPAAWTGEIAGIMFSWTALIGSALLYRTVHPRIYDPATIGVASVRSLATFVSFSVQFAVLIATIYLAVRQVGINWSNPTPVLRIPGSIYYIPVVWFGLSALFRLITRR